MKLHSAGKILQLKTCFDRFFFQHFDRKGKKIYSRLNSDVNVFQINFVAFCGTCRGKLVVLLVLRINERSIFSVVNFFSITGKIKRQS